MRLSLNLRVSFVFQDASGRQLQPNWYYEPEQDADAGRREALAPFTKRVRKSQMSAVRRRAPHFNYCCQSCPRL